MGLLDAFKRVAAPLTRRRPLAAPAREELFDEEFQRKLEYLAMVSKRTFSGAAKAERRTRKTGSGVEFADHRDYAPGDDFRALDWHAYERFDKLLTRLFEEEEDLSIYLVVDSSESMGFREGRKLRYAKQLAAALAYVGLANLDRVAMVTADAGIAMRLEPTRNKKRIFRVFEFLRRVEAGGDTDLGAALRAFVAQHKRRGVAILVSDLYDPAGFEKGINVLRYNKFEPFVLHVVDPEDGRPDLRGDVVVYDCETGERREVTVTPALLGRYREEYDQYLARVERFCVTHQVSYFRADLEVPFDQLILRVLRRGGLVR